MRSSLAHIVRVIWAGVLGVAALASAKAPDWAQPLLARDVTQLGRGYAWVRLGHEYDVIYTADHRVRRTFRGAMRVLTEPGRAAARIAQSYNSDTDRVTTAHAWVISADGKRADYYGPTDFVDVATQQHGVFWPQQRVLSYSAASAIEVKGVLVWEIEVEAQASVNDTTWSFPDDVPTAVCTLDVAPAPGGKLVWRAGNNTPTPTTGARTGGLRWEERDHRPPHSGDRPAHFFPTLRTVVIRALGPDGVDDERTWTDIARLAHGIVQPRIEMGSAELQAKAANLIAGKKTRWDRIRAISEFVQKDVTYLSMMLDRDCFAGYRPHPAAEILKNRFGDCKDKATLFVAMLRAVGEDGREVLVFYGNPTAVLPDWPSPRFNHMIACVPADDEVPPDWPVVDGGPLGRVVLFDPTSASTPLGFLPHGDQGGHGLIVDPRSTALIDLPVAIDTLDCRVDAKVAGNGDVVASVLEVGTGTIGADEHAIRESAGADGFTRAMEARLSRTVSFVDKLHWSDTWAAEQGRLELKFDFVARRYGRITGDLMLIDPQLVLSQRQLGVWTTQHEGVVWSLSGKYHQSVKVSLPPESSIVELPEAWHGEGAHVSGSVRYTQTGTDVVLDCDVVHTAAFLDRASYDSARQFMQKLVDSCRRPILVRLPKTQ